jgi:hypothetical protein
VQVSRNRVQFALPGKNPGCVTITDPFSSYFHVIVELEPPEGASADGIQQVYEKICPAIRETILTGIRKASQKLNYNNSIPEIAFPCPKHDDLHPAIISEDEKLLICTRDRRVYSEMMEQHKLWLGQKSIATCTSRDACLDYFMLCNVCGYASLYVFYDRHSISFYYNIIGEESISKHQGASTGGPEVSPSQIIGK